MLEFLDRLATDPQGVGIEDAQRLHAAGVSHEAAVLALHVSAASHVINRIADALDFEVPPERDRRRMARFVTWFGYRS